MSKVNTSFHSLIIIQKQSLGLLNINENSWVWNNKEQFTQRGTLLESLLQVHRAAAALILCRHRNLASMKQLQGFCLKISAKKP